MTVADAIVAAVDAALPANVTVFDGATGASPVLPYVVVYTDPGLREVGPLSARRDRKYGFQVSSFGVSREQAQWVSNRVTDWLESHRLSVSGWSIQLPVHTYAGSTTFDDDVKLRPTFQCVDQFSVHAFQTA